MAVENLASALVAEARALQEALVADRRHLHQIPEVGMNVPETAAYVAHRLGEMGIAWSPCGTVSPELTEKYAALGYPGITRSTGVVATIGSGDCCFLLRADMDALPIVEENDLPFRSERACSHMLITSQKVSRNKSACLSCTAEFLEIGRTLFSRL